MHRLLFATLFWLIWVGPVWANPTFYFDEGSETVVDHWHSVGLFIKSDGNTLTAARTVIVLPTTKLTYESLLVADYPAPSPYPAGTKPNCFHSPLPAEWGFSAGSASPYLDEDNQKIYLSCGFTNPGYLTEGPDGDKIATITFFAGEVGTDTISLESVNTLFYYGASGATLVPGTISDYSISVLEAIEPTPAPGEIPEKATDSLSEGDLNFVEITQSTGSATTSNSSLAITGADDLTILATDDTIPPAPADLPLRERLQSLLNRISTSTGTSSADTGEILSAQSLRELLIPGKSDADRVVVLFNLISILLFMLIIALITWRLIVLKKSSRKSTRHMSDLLISELAAIESKMGNTKGDKTGAGQGIEEAINAISQEIKETT